MEPIIVCNNPGDIELAQLGGIRVVTAKEYLNDASLIKIKDVWVINLCKSYKYQTTGYYVSLLAEARGHKVIPSITTIQDTKTTSIVRINLLELDELIQKALAAAQEEEIVLPVYFGRTSDNIYPDLVEEIYHKFPAPLLETIFVKQNNRWFLQQVNLMLIKDLSEKTKEIAIRAAEEFFNSNAFSPKKAEAYSYDIAILINPDDHEPPSNPLTINKFVKAASKLGMRAWTITKEDYNHLGEYDALFIRETTNVNHHTYKFARRAAVERMVVMDDPESILRCSNKVYQAQLLGLNNIPTPKTVIISKDNVDELNQHISFPMILKSPDSAFSKGVMKIKDAEQLKKETDRMFIKSELLIAQEFLPSSYDWRIGILDQKPLFACKYYMANEHWQIINQTREDDKKWGGTDTVDIKDVPENVINTALNAANLIGSGLYGVDVKEIDNKSYVIEINDNPNIDIGYEDQILKDDLYLRIMQVYLKRIQELKMIS